METTVKVPLEHARAIKRLLEQFAETLIADDNGEQAPHVQNYAAIMDECIAEAIVFPEPSKVPWTSGLPWGGNG